MTLKQITDSINKIVFNYRYAIRHPSKLHVTSLDSLSYIMGFLEMNGIVIENAGNDIGLDGLLKTQVSPEIIRLKEQFKEIDLKKSLFIEKGQFEKAASLRDEERRLVEKLNVRLLNEAYGHAGPFYALSEDHACFILNPEDELHDQLKKVILNPKSY